MGRDRDPNNGTGAPHQRYQALWPLHTESTREYLTLAANDSSIGRGPRLRQCAFWDSYLPSLLRSSEFVPLYRYCRFPSRPADFPLEDSRA